MEFFRKLMRNCKDDSSSKEATAPVLPEDDDIWIPPPEYVPLSDITGSSSSRNFCINGEVKICSPNGYSFKIVRHILRSFEGVYSGNRRMIGLVKIVIGLTLSGSPIPEGMNWAYRFRRTLVFQWKDSAGPLEGEELDYSQEITWEDDNEFVGLQIRVSAKQCHITGRSWCININSRACQFWADMQLKTKQSEEDGNTSVLLE
ncbi:matrix protein [Ikoma lyssavirus]|uniref:Matrix protein n=1 Tax=Ikoma lyssavirus TaxID=1167696 RepID=J7K3B8_9RHAB|nr:matrix protein [Ikoma lyssavirus]AFQ62096.1 matrix protein [Ikoma lyssavirus]